MSNKRNLNVTAGKLFCLSCGSFSDYQYLDHFVALRDIDEAEMRALAAKAGSLYAFPAELISAGAAMLVDVQEIYLGDGYPDVVTFGESQ